ncbi:UNVERIFIED_ORG: hypothetical protein J2W85_000771 [Ensifer adhaerens]|nr:hypothetical protein [Ensifer adhaerens]
MENEIHSHFIGHEIDARLDFLQVVRRNLFEKVRRFHERGLLLLRIHKDLLVEDIARLGMLPPTKIDLGRLLEVAKSEISDAKPFEEELQSVSDEIHELRLRKLNPDTPA